MKDKEDIFISIVLPVYNVEKYIARALGSLQRQTYKKFEMIFVDDCGADSSIEIVEKYAKKDSRIKIIKNNKNLGTYHARRVGVESASGDYIIFLDPDDELDSQIVHKILCKVNENKLDILFYDVVFFNRFKFYQKKPYIFPKNTSDSLLTSYFSNGTGSYLWGTPGKAYKTSFLKNIYKNLNVSLDFRFVYAEDVFLLISSMLMSPSYGCVYYEGYIYHSNDSSITQSSIGEGDSKIIQYDHMLESINLKAEGIIFNKDDEKTFIFVMKKLLADRFLLIRHSGTATNYFQCLIRSFYILPNVLKVIRMLIFILSLSIVKS